MMGDVSLTPELSVKVFGNPLILEKILTFAITDGSQLSRGDIKRCRLVQKNWLLSISETLPKIVASLFSVDFVDCGDSTGTRSLGLRDVRQFLDTWKIASSGEGNPVFPFDFTLRPLRLNDAATTKEFMKCLVNCGRSVINSCVVLAFERGVSRFVFPTTTAQMHLPNLKALGVAVHGDDDPTASLLLETIFTACEQLQTLWLSHHNFYDSAATPPIPGRFVCPTLPDSLQSLHVFLPIMTAKHVETLLLEKTLPTLSELDITSVPSDTAVWNVLVFRILNGFRLQLKKLTFGKYYHGSRALTFVKLPVMSKLTYFGVHNPNYLWTDNLSELEQFFPEVDTMALHFETASILLNWMQKSQFDAVKKISLDYKNSNSENSLTLQISRQMRSTFRHVVDLTLKFPGPFIVTVLQDIFQEMVQLEKLNVELEESIELLEEVEQDVENYWDSIFLGVTAQFLAGLRSSPELWNAVLIDHRRLQRPSIVNLSEVNTLTLRMNADNISQLTDLTFLIGFFHMPKLKQVNLSGDFQISELVEMKWKAEGRQLKRTIW